MAVNDTRPSSLAKFLRDGPKLINFLPQNKPAGPVKPPTCYMVVFTAALRNASDVQFTVNRDAWLKPKVVMVQLQVV